MQTLSDEGESRFASIRVVRFRTEGRGRSIDASAGISGEIAPRLAGGTETLWPNGKFGVAFKERNVS